MGVRGITKSLDSTSHLQALYERISKVYRASYRECLNIYLSQSGPNSDPTSGEWLMKGGRYFLRSGSGIGSILGEVVTSLQLGVQSSYCSCQGAIYKSLDVRIERIESLFFYIYNNIVRFKFFTQVSYFIYKELILYTYFLPSVLFISTIVKHIYVRESRLMVTLYRQSQSSRLACLISYIYSANMSSYRRRCYIGFLKLFYQKLNLGHYFLVCNYLSLKLFSLLYVISYQLVNISSYYTDRGDRFLVQHSQARGQQRSL